MGSTAQETASRLTKIGPETDPATAGFLFVLTGSYGSKAAKGINSKEPKSISLLMKINRLRFLSSY